MPFLPRPQVFLSALSQDQEFPWVQRNLHKPIDPEARAGLCWIMASNSVDCHEICIRQVVLSRLAFGGSI